MDSGVKARATSIARVAAFVLLNACAGSTAPPTGRLIYLIANGTEDGKDLYSSVVQVIVPSRGGCSGVLAGPNLVLTAAHCLCIPPQGELRPNATYAVSHSNRENVVDLKCSKTVEVIAELYGQATAGARPFTGAIRVQVHEGYAFQTNGAADIIGSQMDLAAVYLGEKFEGVRVDGSILDREVRTGDLLVAVGYGPTETAPPGTRYFGMARVLETALPSGQDKLLAFGRAGVPFRDAYALRGDSGGPCFHEDDTGRRWFVGIMSHSREQADDPITFFTSAFRHREWIDRQKLLSEQYARTR